MTRTSGMTLIEVLLAIALSSMICAIGFTGISAFSRSITRSKQFTSETELIVTAIRAAIASGDTVTSTATPYIDASILATPVAVPKNWVAFSHAPDGVSKSSILTFSNQLVVTTTGAIQTTAATTGDTRKALNMNGGTNTLNIRAFACY